MAHKEDRWSQDTRTPQRRGGNTFIDIGEERMHWQRTVSETDAMRARRAGQVGKTQPRDTPPAALLT